MSSVGRVVCRRFVVAAGVVVGVVVVAVVAVIVIVLVVVVAGVGSGVVVCWRSHAHCVLCSCFVVVRAISYVAFGAVFFSAGSPVHKSWSMPHIRKGLLG